MTWYLETALACAFYGLFAGQLVPTIIARLPEPEPDPEPADVSQDAVSTVLEADLPPAPGEAEERKELYADIARVRGLRAGSALATAVVSGVIGAAVGWSPALAFLLYLAPVGVALAVIDWRTRLLPTKLIAPSYLVVVVLVLFAGWSENDWGAVAGAGWGWLIAGGTFFALWFIYPRGMGYGDVRLSGVLGLVLGYLGWSELLVGIYAGFLVGGLGGALLSVLRIVDRKAYPFGPFMLVGAVVGVVVGPMVASWYS